jgi:hypothetical protein
MFQSVCGFPGGTTSFGVEACGLTIFSGKGVSGDTFPSFAARAMA